MKTSKYYMHREVNQLDATCNLLNMFRALICLKHVEQITRAINHSVASSWFSSVRVYNDARTNIHQIQNTSSEYS